MVVADGSANIHVGDVNMSDGIVKMWVIDAKAGLEQYHNDNFTGQQQKLICSSQYMNSVLLIVWCNIG